MTKHFLIAIARSHKIFVFSFRLRTPVPTTYQKLYQQNKHDICVLSYFANQGGTAGLH